jgi:hypothetical protein
MHTNDTIHDDGPCRHDDDVRIIVVSQTKQKIEHCRDLLLVLRVPAGTALRIVTARTREHC